MTRNAMERAAKTEKALAREPTRWRWEQTRRNTRESVLESLVHDAINIREAWPVGQDPVLDHHVAGLAALRRFLDRVELAGVTRVGVYVDRTDPYDVVWGSM